MSSEWSTFQSFQQSQDLLDAINTLTIHIELAKAGLSEEAPSGTAQESTERIDVFLAELERSLTPHAGRKPMLGAGSRIRQFADRFVEARKEPQRFHSLLVRDGLDEVRALLQRGEDASEEDQEQLLDCLEDLRTLLEEHIHADVNNLLGEI